MRRRSEILRNSRVRKIPGAVDGMFGFEMVEISLRGGSRVHVSFSADEDGWEHVAASPVGSKLEGEQPCPSWEQMRDVKRVFWNDGEMAVQLHPPEDVYLHGVWGDTNILHLWRPADGDWSRLKEKEG